MAEESHQLACSFCGKQRAEVKKLIAGPAAYICDECSLAAARVMLSGAASAEHLSSLAPKQAATCSFCSKKQSKVKKMLASGRFIVCNECIEICFAIIADDELPVASPNSQAARALAAELGALRKR